MKKLVWLAVLVVAVVGGHTAYQKFMDREFASSQTARVTNMLDMLRSRTTPDEQVAMNLWAGAGETTDTTVATQRYEAFDAWRRQGGFQWVDEYQIRSSSLETSGGERRLRMECLINGRPLTLLARSGRPLSWSS
jgi:hypothetical protein